MLTKTIKITKTNAMLVAFVNATVEAGAVVDEATAKTIAYNAALTQRYNSAAKAEKLARRAAEVARAAEKVADSIESAVEAAKAAKAIAEIAANRAAACFVQVVKGAAVVAKGVEASFAVKAMKAAKAVETAVAKAEEARRQAVRKAYGLRKKAEALALAAANAKQFVGSLVVFAA